MKDADQFPKHADIERRAYQIYVDCGREDGRAAEHWLMAEQELLQARPELPQEHRTGRDRTLGETELDDFRERRANRTSQNAPVRENKNSSETSEPAVDPVEEASRESFPASDAPAWISEKTREKAQSKKTGSR